MRLDWNYARYRDSQLEMRQAILSDQYYMFGLCGTGRSGKSYCALGTAIELCIRNAGFRVLYTRATYSSLYKTLIMQTLNDLVRRLGEQFTDGSVPRALIKKLPTAQDGLMVFGNGSIIQFVGLGLGLELNTGSPRLQDVKGGDYALIIRDEANTQPVDGYTLTIHRCAQPIEGWHNKIIDIWNPDETLDAWVDSLYEKYERPTDGSLLPYDLRKRMGIHRSTFKENQSSLSKSYGIMLGFLDEGAQQTYINGKLPDRSGRSFGKPRWAKLPEEPFEKMVIHCDPAITSNIRSCFKAVVLVGLLDGRFWVLECELTQLGTDAMLSAITNFYQRARSIYGFAGKIDCWYENKGLPEDFNTMQKRYSLSEGLPILIPDKDHYGDKRSAIEAIYGGLCEQNLLFWNETLRGSKIGNEMEREHTKYDKSKRTQTMHVDFLDVTMRAARKLGAFSNTWVSGGSDDVKVVVREGAREMREE